MQRLLIRSLEQENPLSDTEAQLDACASESFIFRTSDERSGRAELFPQLIGTEVLWQSKVGCETEPFPL
jgi:hypothetical protein